MPAPVNWEGKRFGKWTAISRNTNVMSRTGKPVSAWNCVCDCGASGVVSYLVLWRGRSRGCAECTAIAHPCMGLAKHPLAATWKHMTGRCHKATSPKFEAYGARGITVCDGWRKSFRQFAEDMGPKPGPGYSVDRIDNSGGYWCGKCNQCVALGQASNCRWATAKQQITNSRTPRFVEFMGERLCLSDWAKRVGISREAMRVRVDACLLEGRPASDAIGPRRGTGGRRSLTKESNTA